MNRQQTIRKLMITAAIAVITITAPAQVYIQSTIPQAGLVQKNQLWNLVLVNGTTGPMEARLTLVLRDRLQNTELLTATTSRFTLPRGSLSVNMNNLSPIQYNYLGMSPNTSLNGLLPAGSYTACYSIARLVGERLEQVAEECAPFYIEALSPPMLIYPADSSALQVNPAQFTWTPPTPAGMFSRLQYEIFITEIKPGQKAAEAMQQNIPFYNAAYVPNNFITYPAALPAFEKEKWYSWQIVARDERSYAGKSEVWVFKVNKEMAPEMIVKGAPFLKMKSEATDMGIAPGGMLKISFFNRTADTEAQVMIYDLSGNDSKPATFSIKIKPGENQAELNLEKKMNISEEHTYRTEIVYSSGEKQSVLFRIKFFSKEKQDNNQ